MEEKGSMALTQSVLNSNRKPKAGNVFATTTRTSDSKHKWLTSSMTADSEPLGLQRARFMNDIINKSIDVKHDQSALLNENLTQATTSRYGDLRITEASAFLHRDPRDLPVRQVFNSNLTTNLAQPLNSSRTAVDANWTDGPQLH